MNIDQFRKPITLSQSNKMKHPNSSNSNSSSNTNNTTNNSNTSHKPNVSPKNKPKAILTKQESIQAVFSSSISPINSNDAMKKRATLQLVNNFTRQNRYTLGVGVRKMSILIDRPRVSFQLSRFQKAVKSVVTLLRLVSLLRSRNSQLVKISLMKIMNLVQAPQNAGIMSDIGICEALIELLDLDPLNHFQIVGMALHGLKLLSLSPECSLKIAFNSHFLRIVETFLRSNTSITQRLAAEIICRCFIQPIQYETQIVNNVTILNLFLKCLYLPYREIQIRVLGILESLTYHCQNSSTIILTSLTMTNLDEELFQHLINIVTVNTNTTDDSRYYAIVVIRNILYAMEVDTSLISSILRSVVNLEHALVKTLRILKNSRSRQATDTGGGGGNALIPKHDTLASTTSHPKRKPSVAMVRRGSLKSFAETNTSISNLTKLTIPPAANLDSIRKTEEIDTIMEILWLIHTSPPCQRVLKNSKLPPPSMSLSTFSSTLVK